MTQQQLGSRKDRAVGETLVISRTDEGFRVYSPAVPSKSYVVGGSPEAPTCTCLDFQHHEGDPQWRCKHILAVLEQLKREKPEKAALQPYEAEERRAIQGEGRPVEKTEAALSPTNGVTLMLLKRSVSPDGRIDSLSVEFSCPVDGTSVKDIKSKAVKTLRLQSQIVESFLDGKKQVNGRQPRNGSDPGAVPAQMLSIGGMDGKWGRRLFLNIQANGRTLRFFGSRKQLGEALTNAGFDYLAPHVNEGAQLNLPCRIITKPTEDGKYLNVERVLPPLVAPQTRGRQ